VALCGSGHHLRDLCHCLSVQSAGERPIAVAPDLPCS